MPDLIPSPTHPNVLIRADLAAQEQVIVQEVMSHDIYRLREFPFLPETVLDVGANIGAFSVKAAEKWAYCAVAAVEPDVRNFQVLLANARSNITPFCAAIGYDSGRRVLQSVLGPKTNSCGLSYISGPGTIRPNDCDGGEAHIEQPCLMVGLATIVKAMGWNEIDLLKLDCEGGEMEIVKSPDLDLAGVIVGEWHGREAFFNAWNVRAVHHFDLEVLHDDNVGLFRALRR